MKTLLFHVNSLLAGGIEKVLIELLSGLDPQKYNIKLSIAHNLGDLELLKKQLPSHVKTSYILNTPILTNTKKKKVLKTITLPEKLFEDLILPLFKKKLHVIKLREFIKDVDVVIDFDMTLTAYTKLLRNKKTVAYCHFSLAHYWDGNTAKLNQLVRRLSRYNKVVMLCDEMKDKAIESYPFLANNVVRIYNAVDMQRIQSLSGESLGEYGHLLEHGYFLSVGRLTESQKDFTMIIKGYAAAITKYGIKESLVIAGTGPSKHSLAELCRQLGVQEKVVFTGFQENPYKWMKHCRLFLFCSKFEGLPTVLIEALSLSCPIIATATPTGVLEALMHGKAGIIIPMADNNALSEAINTLNNNPSLQHDFRENAKDILQKFDIQYMVSEFERLIVNS